MKWSVLRSAKQLLIVCSGLISIGCTTPSFFNQNDNRHVLLSHDDTRHLLSRTGIGVSPADMLRFREMTRQQAIDTLIEEVNTEPTVPMPAWVQRAVPHYHARLDLGTEQEAIFNNLRDAELAQLRQWWTLEMLQTDSPQTERLVLFWHDIFATSYYGTDKQSLAMARQNQTFRKNGFTTWPKLLKLMIRDPALLEYLDAGTNHKDSPNENLARELLELFTLGEGNFDEFTVREAARSLTGHDTDRKHNLAFNLKTWQQDRDSKTLFGITANHDGDDLINVLLKQKSASRFLAQKFWSAYISDAEANPLWLDKVSKKFRQSKYKIPVLYRAVLESDEFWSFSNRGAIVKSPVDLIMGTARSLEYPKYQWPRIASWQTALGMELFAPPNVAGWQEGGSYVTPGRLLNRFNMVKQLVQPSFASNIEVSNTDMSMPPMMGDDRLNSRLKVRIAAEDFQGPALYKVTVLNGRKTIWQGDPTAFNYGHDTEKFGTIENRSEYLWVTESVPVPQELLNEASHVTVAFLNDAKGPDGDRNLYVDGIELDDQWLSGSAAKQYSSCEPELAANAWQMYCNGTLSFSIDDAKSKQIKYQPNWTASDVHLEWASEEQSNDRQSVHLTLDHLKTPFKKFENVEFSLAADGNSPIRLRIESFGCWPTCISVWPECAWSRKHLQESKTLEFPLAEKSELLGEKNRPLACHYESLTLAEKELISVLWNSVDHLLLQASKTPSGSGSTSTIKKMQQKLIVAKNARSQSPYTRSSSVIQIDPSLRPAEIAPVQLVAQPPKVTDASQLNRALSTVSLPLYSLLLPDFQGMNFQRFTLTELLEHPAFQLK